MTPTRLAGCLLLFLSAPARAANDFGNEPITDLPAGLRAQAMGEAFAAAAGGPESAQGNPAALLSLDRAEISLSHVALYGGTNEETFSAGLPRAGTAAYGLTLSLARLPGFRSNDDHGLPAATSAPSDSAISLGAALPAGSFRLGLAASASQTELPGSRRTNGSLHAGILLPIGPAFGGDTGAVPGWTRALASGLTAGASLRHVVSARVGGGGGTPSEFRIGLAKDIPLPAGAGLSAALELEKTAGASARLHAGAELSFASTVFMRVGHAPSLWTFGAEARAGTLALEYAGTLGDLGYSHRGGISLRFGRTMEEQKKAREAALQALGRAMAAGQMKELRDQMRKESEQQSARAVSDGRAFLKKKDVESARAAFQQALAWQPTSTAAAAGLADCDRVQADSERTDQRKKVEETLSRAEVLMMSEAEGAFEAAASARAVLEIAPDNARAKRILEEARARLSPAQKAGADKVPPAAQEKYESGMRAYLAGRLDEACDRFLDAVQAAGRYPQASDSLAQALLKRREAAPPTPTGGERTTSSDRKRAQALYNEGVNHYVGGKLRKAVAVWQEALKLDPANDAIQRDLEQAQRKIRRMDEQKIPIPE